MVLYGHIWKIGTIGNIPNTGKIGKIGKIKYICKEGNIGNVHVHKSRRYQNKILNLGKKGNLESMKNRENREAMMKGE